MECVDERCVCVEQRPLPHVQRRPEKPQASPSENQDTENMFRCVFGGEDAQKKQDNQMQHGRERERGISGWMDGWI